MWNPFKKKSETEPKLFYTTEMHCHILPGVDDGARDLETSLMLIDRMRSWGIERIIASPHINDFSFPNNASTLDPALKQLNDALAERGDTLRVERSAEHRVDELFAAMLEEGTLQPLPNDYLLVENSFMQEAWGLDELLYKVRLQGFRPIMAHPERYPFYRANKERYRELHDAGVLFQANLLSFAGYYGSDEVKAAKWLLEQDYIDFVGTDLHNRRYADAIDAFLHTSAYAKVARALEGRIANDTAFN